MRSEKKHSFTFNHGYSGQNLRIRLLLELSGDTFPDSFFADGGCVKGRTIGTE